MNYVHTFIATSDIHMMYKLKMSKEQVLERAVWAVQYAKDHGLRVEFSAEDATRSSREFLLSVFRAVSDVHADRIDIPDTVGYATPEVHQIPCKRCSIGDEHSCEHALSRYVWLAVANSIAELFQASCRT